MTNNRIAIVVQGEGRGHLTQVLALLPILERNTYDVVGIAIGKSNYRSLPDYFLQDLRCETFQFISPSLVPDRETKGIKVLKSIAKVVFSIRSYLKTSKELSDKLKAWKPDLILSFYEPLLGLAYTLRYLSIPSIGIAHQYTYLHNGYTFTNTSLLNKLALISLTRICAKGSKALIALSWKDLPTSNTSNISLTGPLLDIASLRVLSLPMEGDYILVYLLNKGYLGQIDEEAKRLKKAVVCFCEVSSPYRISTYLNVEPLNRTNFLSHLKGAKAVMTTAGFETIAEALFLNKRIFAVHVNKHFEQACNANDLERWNLGKRGKFFNIEKALTAPLLSQEEHRQYQAFVETSPDIILKVIGNTIKKFA